jgi:hypothetical protein
MVVEHAAFAAEPAKLSSTVSTASIEAAIELPHRLPLALRRLSVRGRK